MALRFLVDECLSPVLATQAQHAGYEAVAIAHHGLSGSSDAHVMVFAETEGYCLVTNNRDDFLELVRSRELHPGLVVLKNSGSLEDRRRQFDSALNEMAGWPDAINKVVEVGVDLRVTVYALPSLA